MGRRDHLPAVCDCLALCLFRFPVGITPINGTLKAYSNVLLYLGRKEHYSNGRKPVQNMGESSFAWDGYVLKGRGNGEENGIWRLFGTGTGKIY